MKTIVILGGGFAGLKCARTLDKQLSHKEARIILIDQKDTHIYTPDLYEIATAFNQKITEACLSRLRDTVAVPFSTILKDTHVEFIRDRVTHIDVEKRGVILNSTGALHFDYLVVALGSVTNYYDIPGLEQFSYPLKTLSDALALCCHLDIYFQTLWKRETKKEVSIVVGGGGFTGIEFACELPGIIDKICKKYAYPRESVTITIIEGSNRLASQNRTGTEIIKKRLKKLGIRYVLKSFIKKVTANEIEIDHDGAEEKISSDILIWTGGVRPHPLLAESFKHLEKNGALTVNKFFQSLDSPRIFGAGDNAFYLDLKTKKPAPLLAQAAVQEARVVAHNIVADIKGKEKKSLHLHLKGLIIPLGGTHALYQSPQGKWTMEGKLVWFGRRLVDLQYGMYLLPNFTAVKKWMRDTSIFVQND